MTRILKAENVRFAYESGNDIFSDLSASVTGGEIAGIVGANGSGKSTLLRVLSGLLKPDSGQVLIDGTPLRSVPRRERARTLAFMPQTVNPAFVLTSFEVVCLGRYPHTGSLGALCRTDIDVVDRCMTSTETAELRDRSFMELSGGERQRVLLASVLAQEPDLLLLDEPTSSLDIHHQIEFFVLLKQLASDGYGIAVVTHDLNLAARFCNSILLLVKGIGLMASGKPEEVLTEEHLSEAYSSPIKVADNPITGTPLICAQISEEDS